MEGTIDHIMINANDYEKALRFYSWLLPKLGYSEKMPHERSTGFRSQKGGLWLSQSEGEFRSQPFDKGRAGLRELAFVAESRSQVDEIAKGVEANGGRIIEMPYQNARGAYQFFFADPEGMKLELICRAA